MRENMHLFYLAMCAFNKLNGSIIYHFKDYFEGDIILTPEQTLMMEATPYSDNTNGPQHAVIRNQLSMWPNGQIPYILHNVSSEKCIYTKQTSDVKCINKLPSLTSPLGSAVTAIMAAIADYQSKTCITFVQRTHQTDYIRFIEGRG